MAGFLPVFNSQCVSLFPLVYLSAGLFAAFHFTSTNTFFFISLSFSVRVTPMDGIQVERITTTSTTTNPEKKMKEMVSQQVTSTTQQQQQKIRQAKNQIKRSALFFKEKIQM